MLAVPFSLMPLFALILLLAMVLLSGKEKQPGTVCFLITCIVLLSLMTLRWQYDTVLLKRVQASCAALLPALAWHGFVSLTGMRKKRYYCLLLAPTLSAILFGFIWPRTIDFVICLLFFGYGLSLIRMALHGENIFIRGRLSESTAILHMALFAGVFLCISALTDLTVGLDFSLTAGQHAPAIIAFFQALLLPLIGFAIVLTGKKVPVPPPESDDAQPIMADMAISTQEQTLLYQRIEQQIRDRQIYLDPNLSLTSLARKTGIPSRQLSATVNATRHCNVSQWINSFRIEHAQRLLRETPLSVTEIMLTCGFSTKSNFNREFLRICGVSPSVFRQQAADNPAQRLEIG